MVFVRYALDQSTVMVLAIIVLTIFPQMVTFLPDMIMGPGVMDAGRTEAALFRPLEIGAMRLRNRIVVAPMCQYSARTDRPPTGT